MEKNSHQFSQNLEEQLRVKISCMSIDRIISTCIEIPMMTHKKNRKEIKLNRFQHELISRCRVECSLKKLTRVLKLSPRVV